MSSEVVAVLFAWALTATVGWLVELLPQAEQKSHAAETSDVDPRRDSNE